MKPHNDLSIIPSPKEVLIHGGSMRPSSDMRIFVDADNKIQAERFLSASRSVGCPRWKINLIDSRNHLFVISKTPPKERRSPSLIRKKEGYHLRIGRDMVRISSRDKAGLFYGMQTLLQLFENDRALPLCTVRDWPDMRIRGVHFDLKGGMPRFPYLKKSIERLAHYKINTILLEYEDKILLDTHPVLAAPSALTKKQARALDRVARKNHIQIIPLLQSLGHVEYILKIPRYRHLGETSDEIQQMCPSNPRTLDFFKEICREIFEIHPESQYFHIGGDETYQLGECKKCKSKAKRTGKYRLYVEYMKKACEFVIENGRIPVMWDDILTRQAPQLLKILPEKTVIMYWLYGIKKQTQNYCYAKNGILASKRWTHKAYDDRTPIPPGVTGYIEDLKKEEYRQLKRYSHSNDFPSFFSSTIFLKKIQESGHGVIGASAALCSADGVIPDVERALPNIKTWAHIIKRDREIGIVSTAWSRSGGLNVINGLMEGNWYPFVASAESYWSADNLSAEEFDARFCRRFFGLGDRKATDCIWLIRHQELLAQNDGRLAGKFAVLAKRADRHKENLSYHGVFSGIFQMRKDVEKLFHSLPNLRHMQEHTVLPRRRLLAFKRQVSSLRQASVKLKKDLRRTVKKMLHPNEVNDCISSYLGWSDYLLKMMSEF